MGKLYFVKNNHHSGNMLIGLMTAVGIGAVMAVVSSYGYIQTLSDQRVALEQQDTVNTALISILDYAVYLTKKRICFDDNLTQIPCTEWCTHSDAPGSLSTCKVPDDGRNPERLLFSPMVAKNIATYLNQVNLRADPNASAISFTDVMQKKLTSYADITSINEKHPLYSVIYPLRHFAKSINIEISREDLVTGNAIPKGREVTLRFKVDLSLDGSSGFFKRALKGASFTQSIPELHAESLITFYPRELLDFALMTSGNLVLANISPDDHDILNSPTITDSFLPVMPQKSSGKGLVFQSPVFTNKSIYLQKDPSPGKPILNEPNYSNITFFDSLIVGDGDIYQKDISGQIGLFKPYNNGGAGSVYHTENINTFGGFQKGVRQEMFDNGLDCALNQTYPLPPDSPCLLNISTESSRCLNRMAALSDLTKTSQTQLVIFKTDRVATQNTIKSSYILGLTPPNEFTGADARPLVRTSNNTNIPKSTCDTYSGHNPCWSGSLLPATGTSTPIINSSDPSKNPLSKQKALFYVNIQLPNGKLGITPMESLWVQADMGNQSQLKFSIPLPKQSDLVTQKQSLEGSITDLKNTLDQLKITHACLTANQTPPPDPSSSPSSNPSNLPAPPLSTICGTTSTADQIQATILTTQSSLTDAQNNAAAVDAVLTQYTNATDPSAPSVQFTLTTQPIAFAYNQIPITIEITNPGLLWSAPQIRFYAYDAGTNSSGLSARKTSSLPGPNPIPNNNFIPYQLSPSPAPTTLEDPYPNSKWMTLPGPAASSEPLPPPVEDITKTCNQMTKSQDFGTASFDLDFTSSAVYYWNFHPLTFTPGLAPDSLIINSSNDANVPGTATDPQFKVYATLPKCVIDQSATLVAGLLVCKELYIDYDAKIDDQNKMIVGKEQTGRTAPLEIIGTIIAGSVHIAPSAIQAGITWRNIYHPDSVATLQRVGILNSDPSCKNPSKPIWSKTLTDTEMAALYSCSPSILRDKAMPFQLTTFTPNCGIATTGGNLSLTCTALLRAKMFKTISIFKQIGVN